MDQSAAPARYVDTHKRYDKPVRSNQIPPMSGLALHHKTAMRIEQVQRILLVFVICVLSVAESFLFASSSLASSNTQPDVTGSMNGILFRIPTRNLVAAPQYKLSDLAPEKRRDGVDYNRTIVNIDLEIRWEKRRLYNQELDSADRQNDLASTDLRYLRNWLGLSVSPSLIERDLSPDRLFADAVSSPDTKFINVTNSFNLLQRHQLHTGSIFYGGLADVFISPDKRINIDCSDHHTYVPPFIDSSVCHMSFESVDRKLKFVVIIPRDHLKDWDEIRTICLSGVEGLIVVKR